MTLQERIAEGEFVLLDGAMGTELERRGVPMDRKAWSAAAMDTHPEVIRNIHEDYIRAGAEIHIVNSFSTARHVLEPAGFGDKVEEFNRRAVPALCPWRRLGGQIRPWRSVPAMSSPPPLVWFHPVSQARSDIIMLPGSR